MILDIRKAQKIHCFENSTLVGLRVSEEKMMENSKFGSGVVIRIRIEKNRYFGELRLTEKIRSDGVLINLIV